jgi:hypothetical protein
VIHSDTPDRTHLPLKERLAQQLSAVVIIRHHVVIGGVLRRAALVDWLRGVARLTAVLAATATAACERA